WLAPGRPASRPHVPVRPSEAVPAAALPRGALDPADRNLRSGTAAVPPAKDPDLAGRFRATHSRLRPVDRPRTVVAAGRSARPGPSTPGSTPNPDRWAPTRLHQLA